MSDQASQANSSFEGNPGQSGVDGGGGDVVDIREQLKSTHGELQQTKSALQDYMGRFETVQKQATSANEVVDRLRQVFDPEAGQQKADPTAEWQQQLDMYLKAAWDADKAGKPIPLTTNLAVQFFQDKIAAHQREEQLTSTINELVETVKALKDPNREVNHRAASDIDATIEEYVERLYGTGDETLPQRSAQYNAIAHQVKAEIMKLQKENPGVWEQVRRNPEKRRKMVEWVVEQNQPPKVRQILEQDRIKNTPLSDGELYAAFNEARQIKDDKTREKILPQIRADIISRMFERQKRNAQGLNQLYQQKRR